MNRRETATVLHFAGVLDGRIRRSLTDPEHSAQTIDEWTDALAHIPATTDDGTWDVGLALRRFYEQHRDDRTARYFAVEPHNLLAAWAEFRSARMARHTDPVPDVDPDDVNAYLAELRATRRAVASGERPPAEYRAALDPARQRQLAALTTGIGAVPQAEIPPEAAEQLRQAGIGARRHTLPALGIPCPVTSCRAHERRWCTSPQGRELRTTVHGQRRDAWAVHTTACPECGAGPRHPCTAEDPHPARIRASLATQEGPLAA
jgi:hypothetical protein